MEVDVQLAVHFETDAAVADFVRNVLEMRLPDPSYIIERRAVSLELPVGSSKNSTGMPLQS